MSALDIKNKLDALSERVQTQVDLLQSAVPLKGGSAEAQEAMVLAFGDLQLLQQHYNLLDSLLGAFVIDESSPVIDEDSDDIPPPPEPSGVRSEAIAYFAMSFGISPEAVEPALIKQLEYFVELFESWVVRFEANSALVQAG